MDRLEMLRSVQRSVPRCASFHSGQPLRTSVDPAELAKQAIDKVQKVSLAQILAF